MDDPDRRDTVKAMAQRIAGQDAEILERLAHRDQVHAIAEEITVKHRGPPDRLAEGPGDTTG